MCLANADISLPSPNLRKYDFHLQEVKCIGGVGGRADLEEPGHRTYEDGK